MSFVWLRLALMEMREGFSLRKGSARAGRDLVALTAFVLLLVALIGLVRTLERGVVSGMADVMLGREPSAGIAIRLVAHINRNNGINRKVLDAFERSVAEDKAFRGLEIYPFRMLSAAIEDQLRFIGDGVWHQDGEVERTRHSFEGWAISTEDPLWSRFFGDPVPAEGLKPRLILNKHTFDRFNYAVYRQNLEAVLPPELLQDLPERLRNLGAEPAGDPAVEDASLPDITTLDTLWLDLRNGGSFDIIQFDVEWVDGLPAEGNVSYLFPLPLYEALEAARYSDLTFFPEGAGAPTMRYQQIKLVRDILADDATVAASAQQVEACLPQRARAPGEPGNPGSYDPVFLFDLPVSAALVDPCLPASGLVGIDDVLTTPTTSDAVAAVEDGYLKVECGFLEPRDLSLPINEPCLDSPDDSPGDIPGYIDTRRLYPAATVYLGDREDIMTVKETLLGFSLPDMAEVTVFRLDRAYEESLARFDFLQKLLRWMGGPLILIGCVVLVYMITVHMFMILQRRRPIYGYLMASGMNAWAIRGMVGMQVFLACLVGGVLAAVLSVFGNWGLNGLFRESAAYSVATETLGAPSMTVSGALSIPEFAAIIGFVFVLVFLISQILLWLMPVRPKRPFIQLMH